MTEAEFATEIRKKLESMRNEAHPGVKWPEGCYGSAAGWLVFLGPSPGGGSKVTPYQERVIDGGNPMWNQDFTNPFLKWSNGFRTSMQPLVETIMGLSLEHGASKLFTVVNFHWQQNPDAASVPEEGMKSGAADTLAVLKKIKPRIIVTMERRSDSILRTSLREAGYDLHEPKCSALISINKNGRSHRKMSGYRVCGVGDLAGSIVVRSPQHPARIYNLEYAFRCARAIRSFAFQVHGGSNDVFIEELA